MAKWFADRSLPYTRHLEDALLSSEFGITSLEEMKVIEMIEWKTLLQHDPLSSEGYGLVKWRVFQEEFRKFASQEFDGTKVARQKKNGGISSINSKGKKIVRKMKTGADFTGSAMMHSAVAAGVLMSAAVLVAKSKSKQQLKLLQNGASKKENNNNNNNTVTMTMTSTTMNSFLAGAGADFSSASAGGAGGKKLDDVKIDIDDNNFSRACADLDDEFAPKTDDYDARNGTTTRTTTRTRPSSTIVPPTRVHSNSQKEDEVSTINMSSYELNNSADDTDAVLTFEEQRWNVKYADLLRYYKLHGTTKIPLKSNATKPKHVLLRRWADKQRRAFLSDKLTEEQIEKLVAVQFDFGQDIEELVAEQIEQERIQAEKRRVEAERRCREELRIQREMEKRQRQKRIESTYVVADVEGGVEAIYVF